MLRGLETVKGQLGRSYPLVIDGKKVTTKETFDSVNPSRTKEVIGHIAKATPRARPQAIAAAAQAFDSWRDTDPRKTGRISIQGRGHHPQTAFRVRRLGVRRIGEVVARGRRRSRRGDRLPRVLWPRSAAGLFAPRETHLPGEANQYVYEPRGVTVVIAPWNFAAWRSSAA